MSKVNKGLLLFSIAIAFAVVSLFSITLGTVSFIVNVLRTPFKWVSEWLINKSDYIILK
jgi:hypothetical protein